MNWAVLIIPLVALAVLILSTIFRDAEEQRELRKPGKPSEEDGRRRVLRRPSSELDRFLDEARRRRETAKPGEAEPPPRPAPVIAPTPSTPRPAPKLAERPVARPAEPAPRRGVEAPLPAPALSSPSPPPAPPAAPPKQSEPAPAARVAPRQAGPVLARLGELLRDRQSVAAAFVLGEMLDRPLCQRRPGR